MTREKAGSAYQIFTDHLRGLNDRMMGDQMEVLYGAGASTYELCFNLEEELVDVSAGSVVLDLGCGNGNAVYELAKKYQNFRFAGVNNTLLPSSKYSPEDPDRPHISTGMLDQLTGKVRRQLARMSLFPPQVVLMRNSLYANLQYGEGVFNVFGLTDRILEQIHTSLPIGGKVLIYESNGNLPPFPPDLDLYLRYINLAKKVGFHPSLELSEKMFHATKNIPEEDRVLPYYLKLRKTESPRRRI